MHLTSCLLLSLIAHAAAPVSPWLPTPLEVPLWPAGVPGAPDRPLEEVLWGTAPDRHVRDVHTPTITLYQPAESDRSGAAVLICPGGGYGVLAIDKEGHEIARWFAERGVCGVVLKNRLPRPNGHVYGSEAPLADARKGLELLHERCEEWAIDPGRIGIMGFSAGGHLAASAAVHLEDALRPDFAVLIYPVVSMRSDVTHKGSRNNLLGPEPSEELLARFSCEENVSPQTPPTFLVHTSDDPVKVLNSVQFYVALQAHGVASELHVYDRGGHGYGLRKPELPVGQWPEALQRWMDVRGLRTPATRSEPRKR